MTPPPSFQPWPSSAEARTTAKHLPPPSSLPSMNIAVSSEQGPSPTTESKVIIRSRSQASIGHVGLGSYHGGLNRSHEGLSPRQYRQEYHLFVRRRFLCGLELYSEANTCYDYTSQISYIQAKAACISATSSSATADVNVATAQTGCGSISAVERLLLPVLPLSALFLVQSLI